MSISLATKNRLTVFLIITICLPCFSYVYFLTGDYLEYYDRTNDINPLISYSIMFLFPLFYYFTLNLLIKAFLPYSSSTDRLKYILIITFVELAIFLGYIVFIISLVHHNL